MRPLNFNLLKALICVICGIVFAVFLVLVLSQIGHSATNHVEVVQKTSLAKDVLKDWIKPQNVTATGSNSIIMTKNDLITKNVNGTDSNSTIVTKHNPFQKFVTETDPNSDPNIEPIEEVAQNHQIEPTEDHFKISKTKIEPIENLNLKKSLN